VSDGELRGAVLDGRYQLIEPLASGAMGSVWRGERVGLGRAVAIKMMHEALPDALASRERFEREAKLMAKLEHPNCVSVTDFGVHDDKPYLVMELVRGTSLLDLITREGHFAPARAAEIMRQVLAGLAHAHELGIVHRDIKPANLMVGDKTGVGEVVRILDFGLARADGQTKLTTGIVVGTPNYMAPEQCRGDKLDGRCDLYACGVILFELLTGRKPFVADDPIAVVRMHLQTPPPRLADVAGGEFGELEAVVARALAKDAAQRYASAHDMTLGIDAAVASRSSLGHAVPHVASAPPRQVATPSGWNLPDSFASTVRAPSSPAGAPEDVRNRERAASQPSPHAAPSGSPVAPATASRGRLPSLSRKQLAIVGGALVLVVVAIVLASRHTGSPPAPVSRDASVAAIVADAADPVAAALDSAQHLLTSDERDAALDVLARARREHPEAASLPLLAGRIYFAKLYWTDGLRELRDAIRLDPTLRSDPELIKTVLKGFITTPYIERALEAFLREDIGAPAVPYLEETAREHPSATVRARAAAELRRMH
jgi:eukaryotic-like serine/threonine-protein kinase